MSDSNLLSVELFIATGCQHCPSVLKELTEQLKAGSISSLNIINIAVDPSRAEELNVRSVPWFSIEKNHGYMIFSGNYSAKEIQTWLKKAEDENGMQDYVEERLKEGELMTLVQAVQIKPDVLATVISMLKDEDTSMDIRIGLDALIEQFSATETLKNFISDFKEIASSNNPRLQIDALHYIALTGDGENKTFLQDKTQHSDKQVKEAAIEALETLNDLID